jgi:hypothetical protein
MGREQFTLTEEQISSEEVSFQRPATAREKTTFFNDVIRLQQEFLIQSWNKHVANCFDATITFHLIEDLRDGGVKAKPLTLRLPRNHFLPSGVSSTADEVYIGLEPDCDSGKPAYVSYMGSNCEWNFVELTEATEKGYLTKVNGELDFLSLMYLACQTLPLSQESKEAMQNTFDAYLKRKEDLEEMEVRDYGWVAFRNEKKWLALECVNELGDHRVELIHAKTGEFAIQEIAPLEGSRNESVPFDAELAIEAMWAQL